MGMGAGFLKIAGVLLGLLLGVPAAASARDTDPERWLHYRELKGTLRVAGASTSSPLWGAGSTPVQIQGWFLLKPVKKDLYWGEVEFRGRLEGTFSYGASETAEIKDALKAGSQVSCGGAIAPDSEVTLKVDFRKGTYVLDATVNGTCARNNLRLEPKDSQPVDLEVGEEFQLVALLRPELALQGFRLPEEGKAFSHGGGMLVVPGGVPGAVPVEASGTWWVEMPEDEIEVSVEPESGFEQWIPEGNLAAPAKPGNHLTLHCSVHQKDQPGEPRKAELTFTWKKVSSEKGICLNWPLSGPSNDSDLQFLKEENSDPGLQVESPDEAHTKGRVEKVDVVISSLDFGAYGTLHITAKDKDGKEVKVRIRGEEKADLAIPFDENHNHLADAWEKPWAGGLRGQETDDDDAQPVGDGHTGDALSLYEEYRGFRISGGAELTANGGRPQELIKGHHVRTSPQVKDVFVCDTLGMGVGAFRVVGLQVHLVKPEECAASRNGAFNPHAINPNRGSFTRGEQYVLWVEAGVTGNGYAGEAIMKGGAPSVPRDCQRIIVSAPSASGSIWMRPDQETLVTLTHELAHACNVKHHGDGKTVDVVRSEHLTEHTVETGEGLLASEEGGSQVSGDVHCYMGYTANFIQELKAPEFRVWDRDGQWYKATKWNVNTPRFAKYRFCDVPSSWELGPAGPPDVKNGRGDCNHQFCVNHLKH